VKRKITLQFGNMVPKLTEQLERHNLPPEIVEAWQVRADAIALMYLQGGMEQEQLRVIRMSLFNEIQEYVEAAAQ
jgi:hypothetical protein